MIRIKTSFWGISVIVLALTSIIGCGGGDNGEPTASTDNQPPTVAINAPLDQAVLPAGEAVQVSVVANDDQAIVRIELYVDNSLIESRVSPSGSTLTTMSEQFTWSASMAGPHALQARAYDASGQIGASRIVGVQVQLPGAPTTTPATSAVPEPTESVSQVTATSAAPTEPTASPTAESARVTANVNANVRGGPGTNYNVVGALGVGETAPVTGRNTDSSWWQISFQGDSAWIANSVVTANSSAYDAPVASAPPPPPTNTPLPPTSTSPPTATPGPSATPIPTSGFRVDQSSLSVGQCTTLRWDFDNIQSIFLIFGYGYAEEGQPGHGTREVCPSVTTTYKARVIKQDSSQQSHEVTVNVSGAGCADPWIEQFAPTTYDVAAGKPFSIFWRAHCTQAVWYKKGSDPEVSVPAIGQKIDETISADTTFRLKVAKNSGGDVYASFEVRIQ